MNNIEKIRNLEIKFNDKDGLLSNTDIINLCKILKLNLIDCDYKDRLPNKCLDGSYIINLESSSDGSGGSHWVALYCKNHYAVYFDSFGASYPLEIQKFTDNRIVFFNSIPIQMLDDSHCGWYCIAFLFYMVNNSGQPEIISKNFIEKFNMKNAKLNEKKLKLYIKSIFITNF